MFYDTKPNLFELVRQDVVERVLAAFNQGWDTGMRQIYQECGEPYMSVEMRPIKYFTEPYDERYYRVGTWFTFEKRYDYEPSKNGMKDCARLYLLVMSGHAATPCSDFIFSSPSSLYPAPKLPASFKGTVFLASYYAMKRKRQKPVETK